MITYLLRRNGASKETCNGIITAINSKDVKCVRSNHLHKLDAPDILIRYGCKVECQSKFEINNSTAIELVNDKIESRKKLIEAGISTPKTYFSKQEIFDNIIHVNWPLIARRGHHSQGSNFIVANNNQDVIKDKTSAYWSEVIKKDREFRIFCFFGRVISASEKIPVNKDLIPWNNSIGNGVFKTIKSKNFPLEVCHLALKAAKVLNIDFAGIDIISKDNKHYVLEGNVSCQLSPYRQQLHAKAFTWLINQIEKTNEKPKHFELPELARSYKSIRHPCLFKKGEENENIEEIKQKPEPKKPKIKLTFAQLWKLKAKDLKKKLDIALKKREI